MHFHYKWRVVGCIISCLILSGMSFFGFNKVQKLQIQNVALNYTLKPFSFTLQNKAQHSNYMYH